MKTKVCLNYFVNGCRMIFIDLQKAFDTTNHEILLKKLETTGFLDQCIQWFRSCFGGRMFFVETENQLSINGTKNQDSILSTTRFYFKTIDVPYLYQRHASSS